MLGRLLVSSLISAFLGTVGLAQTANPPAAAAPTAPSAPTSTAPVQTLQAPKKVWDNENLRPNKDGVSVVGDKRGQNYHMTPEQSADSAEVARYRKDLEKLQGQLADVKKQLKNYKEFQDGEPVSSGARDFTKGVNRVPVDQQLTQLQEKRKKLEAQISDLYDEARKKGIDSGQLP